MADTAASRKLAQKLADYEARIKALEAAARTPQLQNASITGTAITVYDDDGETPLQYIGKQADGSQGIVHVNGPTPPVPSAATVEPTPLGLTVSWDGAFADDIPQPAGFDHVAVHVTTGNASATASGDTDGTYLVATDADAADVAVGDTVVLAHVDGTPVDDVTHTVTLMESAFGFTNIHLDPPGPPLVTGDVATVVDLSEVTRKGTLSRAGSISLTPLTTDPHYVRLVAVSASGIQSDPSAQTAGTPLPAADIRPGSITETEIADDSISTPKLRAEAVTADKIAANTITTGQIAAGAITAETLSADAIDGKVITGAIVQTATEGNRVTLDGPDGVLVFYSGDAAETSPATAAAFAGDFGDGTSLASLQLFAPTLNGNAGNVLIELFSIGGGDRINLQAPQVDINNQPAFYADVWTDLTLTSPYRAHNTVSGGFGYTPQYRFIGPNTVQLRGVVSRSSGTIATSDVVAALPTAVCPAEQHCGLVACGTAPGSMWSVRMDVRGPGAATSPNSLVLLFTAGYAGSGTGAGPGWVSLDGITYDLS